MNVRSTPFNVRVRQRRASLEISLLVVLASLVGCAGNRAADADAQPAADRVVGRDAADAANVLRDYFDAIADGDYARAYGLRQSEKSLEEFQRSFANVTAVEPEIGDPHYQKHLVVGSQNLIFPVKVRFTHADGSQECLEGTYMVSKPVVPDARWTITSSDLKDC